MKTFSVDSRKFFNVFFRTTNHQQSNIQFSQMKLNKVVLDSPDPKCFCESLKLKWVKKIINEDASCIWKILIENQLEFVGGNLIWQCSFNDKDYLLLKIKSRFLLDVLVAWSHFRFQIWR